MQYRKDKKGQDISLLGYGCMRFTRRGGGIDLEKAEREVTAVCASPARAGASTWTKRSSR